MEEKFYNLVEGAKYTGFSRYVLGKLIQRYQYADWAKGYVFIIGENRGIRYAISKTFLDILKKKVEKKEIKPISSLNSKFVLISLDSLLEFSKKNKIKTLEQLKKNIEKSKEQVKSYLS